MTGWKVTESLNQARSSLCHHRMRTRKGLLKASSASLSPLPLRVLRVSRTPRRDLESQSWTRSTRVSPLPCPSFPHWSNRAQGGFARPRVCVGACWHEENPQEQGCRGLRKPHSNFAWNLWVCQRDPRPVKNLKDFFLTAPSSQPVTYNLSLWDRDPSLRMVLYLGHLTKVVPGFVIPPHLTICFLAPCPGHGVGLSPT